MKTFDQASIVKATICTYSMQMEQAKSFFQTWQEADGVQCLSILLKKQKIQIHYDVKLVDLNTILEAMTASRIMVDNSWLNRWRLNTLRQVEQNVRDNIRHVPHCCGKPPK
ncbi:hypothetical protein MSP8886_02874 [Marinomonas spartinae]|uniref:Uncharacterized protein n=1 Tax=Marinomonas spartinae TaxID=1792290 RepID=A0A1A8TLD0_9GAMM|nr:hypothetical protein [Marinomonas spartinae]SBS33862.1 hypothetical protein MSP8886_02874 [Marinomonas spartinae]